MVSSGSTNYTTERIKPMIQKHFATEKTQLLHCPQDVPWRAGGGWAPSCKEKEEKELVYKDSHFCFIQATKLGGQRGEKRNHPSSSTIVWQLSKVRSKSEYAPCIGTHYADIPVWSPRSMQAAHVMLQYGLCFKPDY